MTKVFCTDTFKNMVYTYLWNRSSLLIARDSGPTLCLIVATCLIRSLQLPVKWY